MLAETDVSSEVTPKVTSDETKRNSGKENRRQSKGHRKLQPWQKASFDDTQFEQTSTSG
jgi:hypothetical protein